MVANVLKNKAYLVHWPGWFSWEWVIDSPELILIFDELLVDAWVIKDAKKAGDPIYEILIQEGILKPVYTEDYLRGRALSEPYIKKLNKFIELLGCIELGHIADALQEGEADQTAIDPDIAWEIEYAIFKSKRLGVPFVDSIDTYPMYEASMRLKRDPSTLNALIEQAIKEERSELEFLEYKYRDQSDELAKYQNMIKESIKDWKALKKWLKREFGDSPRVITKVLTDRKRIDVCRCVFDVFLPMLQIVEFSEQAKQMSRRTQIDVKEVTTILTHLKALGFVDGATYKEDKSIRRLEALLNLRDNPRIKEFRALLSDFSQHVNRDPNDPLFDSEVEYKFQGELYTVQLAILKEFKWFNTLRKISTYVEPLSLAGVITSGDLSTQLTSIPTSLPVKVAKKIIDHKTKNPEFRTKFETKWPEHRWYFYLQDINKVFHPNRVSQVLNRAIERLKKGWKKLR